MVAAASTTQRTTLSFLPAKKDSVPGDVLVCACLRLLDSALATVLARLMRQHDSTRPRKHVGGTSFFVASSSIYETSPLHSLAGRGKYGGRRDVPQFSVTNYATRPKRVCLASAEG